MLFFIKHKIRLFFALQVHFYFFIKDRVQYFFEKSKLSKFNIIYDCDNPVFDKVCVFVSYQYPVISNNNWLYLQSLYNNGYSVWYLSNNLINENDIEKLKSLCSKVIVRENIGRDFGAYKCGVELFLKSDSINATKELLVVNDSVYVQPEKLNALFKQIQNMSMQGWFGAFENYQTHYHVTSWFLGFKPDVFKSTFFRDFWNNYKPYNSRFHAINQGEVGLSKKLTKHFSPNVIYSSVQLQEKLQQLDWEALNQTLLSINYSTPIIELLGDAVKEDCFHEAYVEQMRVKLLNQVVEKFETQNPTHQFPFGNVSILDAPFLKKDICYRGICSIAKTVNFARENGFDSSLIALELKVKGLPTSVPRSQRFLHDIGAL